MWCLASDLSLQIADQLPARVCKKLPGFRRQIVRAAVSVSANISEGCGRDSNREFKRYLGDSLSSLFEVEGYLKTALDGKMLEPSAHLSLIRRAIVLRRMIISFRDRLDDRAC